MPESTEIHIHIHERGNVKSSVQYKESTPAFRSYSRGDEKISPGWVIFFLIVVGALFFYWRAGAFDRWLSPGEAVQNQLGQQPERLILSVTTEAPLPPTPQPTVQRAEPVVLPNPTATPAPTVVVALPTQTAVPTWVPSPTPMLGKTMEVIFNSIMPFLPNDAPGHIYFEYYGANFLVDPKGQKIAVYNMPYIVESIFKCPDKMELDTYMVPNYSGLCLGTHFKPISG